MDQKPPIKDCKKSTLHRWQEQVSVHLGVVVIIVPVTVIISSQFHQTALIAQCTLRMQLNDNVFVIYEHVPKTSDRHMKESITRIHIVNLEGFLWKDDATNVTPTCTCPSNCNLKDCCAGIMFAIQRRQEFKEWYGKCFTEKKELLHRRLRADLDPVSVHFDMVSNAFIIDSSFCHSASILQSCGMFHVQSQHLFLLHLQLHQPQHLCSS